MTALNIEISQLGLGLTNILRTKKKQMLVENEWNWIEKLIERNTSTERVHGIKPYTLS